MCASSSPIVPESSDEMKDTSPSRNGMRERQNIPKSSFRERLRNKITPKAKAAIYMSICTAVHFSGHELARGPCTSMFTSKDIGFQNPAALPLCIGLVSPFTIIVLWVSFLSKSFDISVLLLYSHDLIPRYFQRCFTNLVLDMRWSIQHYLLDLLLCP